MMASTNPKQIFDLTGKTVIATGGTGGLGLAMTSALASAGADIISIEQPDDKGSAEAERTVRAAGRRYYKFECDLSDMDNVRCVFDQIWIAGHEYCDILLNSAGVQKRADAIDFSNSDIDFVLNINLKAAFAACQEFAKRLIAQGRPGKIINVGSILSVIGGMNITPYAASKGAIMQMTKAMSNEWASKGIQCNCIHPGYFKTSLTEQYSEDPKYREFNDYLMIRTPAKRWGKPSELAGAVIFLASNASDYMTGSSITVDGGWTGM